MHYEAIQCRYNQLKPKSVEADVDNMWGNILPLYFEVRNNYTMAPRSRPWPGVVKARADFTIRTIQHIRNGQSEKVVIIGDKRVSDESSDAAWKDAVYQVTEYMKAARATIDEVETIYAIVTVGRYSRFYELSPGEQILQDYGNTGGKPYEFKKDEASIDTLLLELVDKTSP